MFSDPKNISLSQSIASLYFKYKKKLKFESDLEKSFQERYFNVNIKIIRIALICALILYNLFGILDYFIDNDNYLKYIFIRSILVTPFLVITILLSFSKIFIKIMNPILSLVSIMSGTGIISIIVISQNQYIHLMYYTGLVIIIFAIYTFLRLNLLYSLFAGWGVYIIYLIGILFFLKTDIEFYNNIMFIGNSFFLISKLLK